MRTLFFIIFSISIFSYAGIDDPIIIEKDSCTIHINNTNNQVTNGCTVSKPQNDQNDFWSLEILIVIVISVITFFGIYLTNKTNRKINANRSIIMTNIKWLYNFRKYLASFLSQSERLFDMIMQNESDPEIKTKKDSAFIRLNNFKNLLKVLLNLDFPNEQSLFNEIDKLELIFKDAIKKGNIPDHFEVEFREYLSNITKIGLALIKTTIDDINEIDDDKIYKSALHLLRKQK